MKKPELTKEDREDIAAMIDQEGFAYYFLDYGADDKLKVLIGKEIDAFKKASDDLRRAVEDLGIEI